MRSVADQKTFNPFRLAPLLGAMLLLLIGSGCTQITPIAKIAKRLNIKVGRIIPSSGNTSGGTLISIQGSGFAEGSTVRIGSQDCLNVTFVSTTELQCTTPAGMPEGILQVVITALSGRSLTLASGFRAYEMLPPVAGRVVAAQGGILTGNDGNGDPALRLHLTVGEPVASSLQNGEISGQPGTTVLKARLGIQGVLFDQ